MTKYFKTILFTICLLAGGHFAAYSQQMIQNRDFTYVPIFNNKAVLLMEIPLNNVSKAAENYTKLKSWIKDNYTTDLINSSIMYYPDDQAVLVKSKVDLLLPILNNENVSEKSVMTYHLYTFIQNGVCVMQITDMEYKVTNTIPALKQKVKAEDFITNEALKINDEYRKERVETQKGTLYFFNQLAKNLGKTLNGDPEA